MAVGVRSSSNMRSSLRSISSKRRRIRERLSAGEVMSSPHRSNEAPATTSSQGPSWQSGIELGLFTLRWWKKCACSLASPTSPQADAPYVGLTPPADLFVCAKDLFLEAI